MAAHFEFDDLGPVGGVPDYALREAEPDPLAANAVYAGDPDAFVGASIGDSGDSLSDTDDAGETDDTSGADGPSWLDSILLADNEPVARDESTWPYKQPGWTERTGYPKDPDTADTSDGSEAATYPATEAAVDAAQPAGEREAERAAEPADVPGTTEVQPGDDDAEQADSDPDDDPAQVIADELDIDIDEARELVAEAMADEHGETADDPDETDSPADGAHSSDDEPVDEHESGEEGEEAAQSDDRVVSFLRSVASGAGRFTSNEAGIFAEGVKAAGSDLRDWFDNRHERRDARALARTRKDLTKSQKDWDKLGRARRRSSVEAPRRRRQ